MNHNIVNIIGLGAVSIFLMVFWGLYQVSKDEDDMKNAIASARSRAESDAASASKAFDFGLMHEVHHWGRIEIPLVNNDQYELCVKEVFALKTFRELIEMTPWKLEHHIYLDDLRNSPEVMGVYAHRYNEVVIQHAKSSGYYSCL